MKLSDINISITFTDEGKPTVTFSVTFDNTDQMQEYIEKLTDTFEKGLTDAAMAQEILEGLKKKTSA